MSAPEKHPAWATSEFTPETWCPRCGTCDVHGMRDPHTIAVQDEAAVAAYTASLQVKIDEAVAGGMPWREAMLRYFPGAPKEDTGLDVPPPIEVRVDPKEAMWTTIRVCRCGREWGQK